MGTVAQLRGRIGGAGGVDYDRLLDSIVVAENSGSEAISSATARSRYQIIPKTFRTIRERRKDLPRISHEDLSKPENDSTARLYAKAVISDMVNRGITDPADIFSTYNSGRLFRRGKKISETRKYVPRALAAYNSRGATQPGEGARASSRDPGAIPTSAGLLNQDERGVAETVQALMSKLLSPEEAQGAELQKSAIQAGLKAERVVPGSVADIRSRAAKLVEKAYGDEGTDDAKIADEEGPKGVTLAQLRRDADPVLQNFRRMGQDHPILTPILESFPAQIGLSVQKASIGLTEAYIRNVLGREPSPAFKRLKTGVYEGIQEQIEAASVASRRLGTGGKVLRGASRVGPDLPFLMQGGFFAGLPKLLRLPALFVATEAQRSGATDTSIALSALEGLKLEATFGIAGKSSQIFFPGSRLASGAFQAGGAAGLAGGESLASGLPIEASDLASTAILGGTLGFAGGEVRPGLRGVPLGQRAKVVFSPAEANPFNILGDSRGFTPTLRLGLGELAVQGERGFPLLGPTRLEEFGKVADSPGGRAAEAIGKFQRDVLAEGGRAGEAIGQANQGLFAGEAVGKGLQGLEPLTRKGFGDRSLFPETLEKPLDQGGSRSLLVHNPKWTDFAAVDSQGTVLTGRTGEVIQPEVGGPGRGDVFQQGQRLARETTEVRKAHTSLIDKAYAEIVQKMDKPQGVHPNEAGGKLSVKLRKAVKETTEAAEKGGEAPEGFTATAQKLAGKDALEAAMLAEGRTVIPSENIVGGVLPPAGMVAFSRLSRADRGLLADVGVIEGNVGTPSIIMAKNNRSQEVFDIIDRGIDPTRRFLLDRWMLPITQAMSMARKEGFEIPKDAPGVIGELAGGKRIGQFRVLRPVEDLRRMGKHLDGKDRLTDRPDLFKAINGKEEGQAMSVKEVIDEVAKFANLPKSRIITEYFPHILRSETAFVGDLPGELTSKDPAIATRRNRRLREAIADKTKSEVKLMKDAILGNKRAQQKVSTKSAKFREDVKEVRSVLASTAEEFKLPAKALLVGERSYFDFILKGSLSQVMMRDVAVDIGAQIPKELFLGSLSKDREVLNPEFLEFNAHDVLRIYIYGASRKIAFDTMGGSKLAGLVEKLKVEQEADSRLPKYTEEFIDNYLGRNKKFHNRTLQKWLLKRKSIIKLGESDNLALKKLAGTLLAPLPATRFSGAARAIQFSSKIAGNLVTPIINSTQTLTNAMPLLSRNTVTGKSVPFSGLKFLKRAGLWAFSPAFRDIRRQMMADGVFNDIPKFQLDAENATALFSKSLPHAGFFGALRSLPAAVVRGIAVPFKLSEFNNRGLSYAAAYLRRLDDLAPQLRSREVSQEQAIASARQYSRELMNRTQFRGGRVETPLGLQRPILSLAGQFKTFSIKEIELFKSMTWGERAQFVTVIVALAGPQGIPLLRMLDPGDDWWPSAARLAGVNLSDQFGISIFGVPRGLNDFGSFFLGPFPSESISLGTGLLKDIEGGEFEATPRALLGFTPGGAQLRRFTRDPNATGRELLFGPNVGGK